MSGGGARGLLRKKRMAARRGSGHPPAMSERALLSEDLGPDALAWSAVVRRDSGADGRFVYAVRTTGVFCRPSCHARRPRRENVLFFPGPAEATHAGYRACLRCRPAGEGDGERAVARAIAFLEARGGERVRLAELAEHVGLSPSHLQRTFTRAVGVSPRAFQDARRLARFKAGVRRGGDVGSATYEAGYGSTRGLYERARARLGMTPATYRRGGLAERIRFTTTTCELGRLLVAVTERGVCAVELGDDDARLEESLRGEFPRAEAIERDDVALRHTVLAVLSAVDGRARAPLRLDLRGTAFQVRVWQALLGIARGETRSYSEIAVAVGQPSATRAVARACGANRLALLVPCHRVVRGDGGLGGYRWGTERKRRVLEREREPERKPGATRPSSRRA